MHLKSFDTYSQVFCTFQLRNVSCFFWHFSCFGRRGFVFLFPFRADNPFNSAVGICVVCVSLSSFPNFFDLFLDLSTAVGLCPHYYFLSCFFLSILYLTWALSSLLLASQKCGILLVLFNFFNFLGFLFSCLLS